MRRTFLVSYNWTDRGYGVSRNGFGSVPYVLEGPLDKAAAEKIRREIEEATDSVVIIMGMVPLESETLPLTQPGGKSHSEAMLRQRLTDLIAMWRKDTGQYTRTGKNLAASDLARVLESETGQ